jgi:hypothetical protein
MADTLIPQLDRLKAQLLTSGLSEQNQALFQIINQLIDALRQSTTEITTIIETVSAAGSPGGSNGQVQYNFFGAFAGATDLVYDRTTRTVRIGSQANTIYKLNIIADASINQSLLGIYSNSLTNAIFDIFLDGSGAGVWRVLSGPTIKVQVSANGDSFFAGGFVGFTGGFPAFTPTAFIHAGAGTTSFVPFKFTIGSLTTAPQVGAVEYDGTYIYYTNNAGIRRPLTGIDHVPVSTGAEPLQIMSDGAGNVLLVGFTP